MELQETIPPSFIRFKTNTAELNVQTISGTQKLPAGQSRGDLCSLCCPSRKHTGKVEEAPHGEKPGTHGTETEMQ